MIDSNSREYLTELVASRKPPRIDAARELEEERLRDLLVEHGWVFMGSVGPHHYWFRPHGGWAPEAEAFNYARRWEQVAQQTQELDLGGSTEDLCNGQTREAL